MTSLRVLSSTILSLAFITSASAQAPVAMSKAEVQAIVKETLMNEPAIIMEALEKLRQQKAEDAKKEARAAIDQNKAELFKSPDSPFIGAENGDVTVVEFFDYHCGYCKHFVPELNKLVETDKNVRVVLKDFPILSEDSVTAARASIAAHRIAKPKYFAYHSALMAEKGKFNEARLLELAKKVGIDDVKLKAEMAKPEITAILDKNREMAEKLDIRGTPALIIGTQIVPGAASFEEMKKAIDKARAKMAAAK